MKRSIELVKRLSRVSFDREFSKKSTESARNQAIVKIEFDDEKQGPCLLPNSTVRGRVVLEPGDDLFRVGKVKIQFRCEERQFQNVEYKNWKSNPKKTRTLFKDEKVLYSGKLAHSDVRFDREDKLDGRSEYRFALEFPNVNYPPSLRDPAVYRIMYIWTAYVVNFDTFAVVTSEEVFSPYRPILLTLRNNLWGYESILKTDADDELAAIEAEFEQKTYSQVTPIKIRLTIEDRKPHTKLHGIKYNVRKHSEDKLTEAYKKWIDIQADQLCEIFSLGREYSPTTAKIPLKDMNSFFACKTPSGFKYPHYDILLRITYTDESMRKRFWRRKKYKRNVSIPLIIDNVPYEPNALNSLTEDFQNWPKPNVNPLFLSQSLQSPLVHKTDFSEVTRRSYYPDREAFLPELVAICRNRSVTV